MTYIVFLLEEESAKCLLEGLLANFFPENIYAYYLPHEGKQDLEKSIPIKLKNWNLPNSWFVIMRDKDSDNLDHLQAKLEKLCVDSGRPEAQVSVVVHELESWVLGDLNAVGQAYNMPKLAEKHQNSIKFRDPDRLGNAHQELKRLVTTYQKTGGARKVAPLMDIQSNKSISFQKFIADLTSLVQRIQ